MHFSLIFYWMSWEFSQDANSPHHYFYIFVVHSIQIFWFLFLGCLPRTTYDFQVSCLQPGYLLIPDLYFCPLRVFITQTSQMQQFPMQNLCDLSSTFFFVSLCILFLNDWAWIAESVWNPENILDSSSPSYPPPTLSITWPGQSDFLALLESLKSSPFTQPLPCSALITSHA